MFLECSLPRIALPFYPQAEEVHVDYAERYDCFTALQLALMARTWCWLRCCAPLLLPRCSPLTLTATYIYLLSPPPLPPPPGPPRGRPRARDAPTEAQGESRPPRLDLRRVHGAAPGGQARRLRRRDVAAQERREGRREGRRGGGPDDADPPGRRGRLLVEVELPRDAAVGLDHAGAVGDGEDAEVAHPAAEPPRRRDHRGLGKKSSSWKPRWGNTRYWA